jgi:hypothetical protein
MPFGAKTSDVSYAILRYKKEHVLTNFYISGVMPGDRDAEKCHKNPKLLNVMVS